MDPGPIILLGVLTPPGVALVWAMWWSTSSRHAAAVGTFLAAAVGFHLPLGLFCSMITWDDFAGKADVLFGAVIGMFGAVLAALPGLVAGVIGRLLSTFLFPVGPDRGRHESLVALSHRLGGNMTLKKALSVIIGMTVLSGALGCLGGYLLGKFNPGYYRAVFHGGERPDFDPIAVGVGLGLSQWAAAGAVLGVVLVLVLTWYDLRCRQIAADATRAAAREEAPPPRHDRITQAGSGQIRE